MPGRLRCVASIALTTPIPLVLGRIEARFVLFLVRLALGTFHFSYSIPFLSFGPIPILAYCIQYIFVPTLFEQAQMLPR